MLCEDSDRVRLGASINASSQLGGAEHLLGLQDIYVNREDSL